MAAAAVAAVTPGQPTLQFRAPLPWRLVAVEAAALLVLLELRALQLLLVHIRLAAAAAELLGLLALQRVVLAASGQHITAVVAVAFRREVQRRGSAALAAAGRLDHSAMAGLAGTIHRQPQTTLAQAAAATAVARQAATLLAQPPAVVVTDTLALAAAVQQRPRQPAQMAAAAAALMLVGCRDLVARGLRY